MVEKNIRRKLFFFATDGKEFNQDLIDEWREYDSLVMISGHYEGIDDRVSEVTNADRVYVGKTILSGGELPSLFIIDSISRQIKGVLGNSTSIEMNRNASSKVYTRPDILEWKGNEYKVPDVLSSGHHRKIEEWRSKNSNKPDNVE